MKSTVSQSQSSSTANSRKIKSDRAISPFSNFIFNLFDKITRDIDIPYFLYFPFIIFYILQCLSTSLWVRHSNFWTDEIVNKYLQIPYIHPLTKQPINKRIMFGVFCGIIVVSLVLAIILFFEYRKSKKQRKALLYALRFIVELLSLIIMIPLMNFLGNLSVAVFGGEESNEEIIFMTITLVGSIVLYVLVYIMYKYINSSAFLSLSLFSAFDIDLMIRTILVLPVFALFDEISRFFPKWTHYLLVIVHFLYVFYLLWKIQERPFVRDFMNWLFGFAYILLIIYDIIGIITFFLDSPPYLHMILAYIICCPVAIAIETIIYVLQTRQWMKIISEPCSSEVEKVERFRFLMIDKSASRFNKFYFFVITNVIREFLNTLFIRFVIENNDDIKTTVRCVKFLAYLPTEYRLMNLAVSTLEMKAKLPNDVLFLIYQVHKTLIVRQSSQSADVVERFLGNVKISKEVVQSMLNFWTKSHVSIYEMVYYYDEINYARAKWEDILNDIPNNSYYMRIYANYLIDGCTDIKSAVMMTYKANMIDTGSTFHHDTCFRHFVRNFPKVLKKKVMDVKGNMIGEKVNNNKSHNSSKGSNQITSTSTLTSIDSKIEEEIGKSLVTSFRLRYALQTVTENKRAKISTVLISYILFDLVVSLTITIFIFVFYHRYFDERNLVAQRTEYCNLMRFSYVCSTMNMLLIYGEKTGTIDRGEYIKPFRVTEPYDDSVFTSQTDFSYNSMEFVRSSMGNYSALTSSLSKAAITNDITQSANNLLYNNVPLVFCASGMPAPYVLSNMMTIMSNNFMSIQMGQLVTDYSSWFHSSAPWCSLITTLEYSSKYFLELTDSLLLDAKNEVDSSTNEILIMIICIPIIHFFLVFVGMLVVMILAKLEVSKFINLLLGLDSVIKKEAMNSLCKKEDTNDEDAEAYQMKHKFNQLLFFIILTCLISLLEVCVIIGHLVTINKSNIKMNNAIMWISHTRMRKSMAIETCLWGHLMLLFGGGLQSNFTSLPPLVHLTQEALEDLNGYTQQLYSDGGGSPPIIGVNKWIDFYEMSEQCESNTSSISFHEQYRCGGSQNLISHFGNMISDLVLTNANYGGKITDGIPALLLELVVEHMIPMFVKVDNAVKWLANSYTSGHSVNNAVFFAVEVVIAFFLFIVMLRTRDLFKKSYNCVLIFMRRVSPFALVQSQDLMDYLLNRKVTLNTARSVWQSIIAASNDGIMCIGVTGLIEIINPAISTIFGYSADQIVGQQLSEIIDEEDQAMIKNRMEMIKNGQSSPVYEDHIKCNTDSAMTIKCQATLIGIKKHDEFESFILVLRDESDLLEQQEIAEEAKKKSETLLYQIIPRNIVTRINQGEKEISFVVPMATIMFIDIVKFTEVSSTMTPSEIMQLLTSVFEMFDNFLKKYNDIIKIKLIGDVYMSASGLFNDKDPPQFHAQQMVKFGLDCIQGLEEFNIKNNLLLAVRVGVNCGGPIIAGVLGTDKPTFDIIGDPINIASRLQSTSLPGQIQISSEVHNMLADSDIEDQYRGEVMLKGKGKTATYTVVPKKFGLNGTLDDLINTGSLLGSPR